MAAIVCGLSHPQALNYRFQKTEKESLPKEQGGIVEVVTTSTTPFLERKKRVPEESNKRLQIQSKDVPDVETSDLTTTSEVVTFVDNSAGVVDSIEYSRNPIASASATKNTSLAKFLSRPTLIDTRTWSTADLIGYKGSTIEPWYLYLNNSVIKQKLTNYAFLRAKLCLKVVINATPFHFGLMRVAYQPNVNAADTGDRKNMIRTNPTSSLPYMIPLSQLPGIWVHPSDNSGGELHVPFFYQKNWLKLTSAADVKTMGALYYYINAVLGVASSTGSSTVTIDTFAWLEDVEFSGATSELTLQSRDEYDGPISRVASSVAQVSGRLTDVPVIGKFARATSIGAGALAQVASIFGFTNTPVIEDIPARIPMPGPPLASAEIGTQIQKLTLDPKQELSIDPTLHGLDSKDQMAISNICTIPSVLTTTGWSTTDAIGTVLFNANVSPMLFGRVPILDAGLVNRANRVYHTPMSYLGMMFTHWRGDIIFDVEVVCTKFHKGRLKIAWDPLGSGGATALSENTVYTTILDVGENNKASFRVPFHQAFAWCRTRGITRDNWTPGNALPVDDKFDNGLFLISVLTPLMSPVTPQNVAILITVRGSETLEYANPKSSLGDTSGSPSPSFFAVQARDEVDIHSSEETLGDSDVQHPERFALNFGESIVSLRNVLHRSSIYDVSTPFASSATRFAWYGKSYSRLPPMFGYDPNGLSGANRILAGAGSAQFNFVPTHPITYVAMMFGAFRGGVNYTANVSADLYPYIGDIRVQRMTDTTLSANRRGRVTGTQNTGVASSTTSRFLYEAYGQADAGAAFTNSQTNGAISWNQPQLSGVNFNFTDPTYAMTGNTADQTDLECSLMEILLKQQTANTVTELTTITTYAGSGVDFTCLWWLMCPTLDYYTALPAGAP